MITEYSLSFPSLRHLTRNLSSLLSFKCVTSVTRPIGVGQRVGASFYTLKLVVDRCC